MLTAILASVAALQAPAAAKQQLLDMSHMVRDGRINPLRETHTVEWICSKGAKPSRITIKVEDIGVRRNDRFKIELISLVVAGDNPSPEIRDKVRSLLAGLNSFSILAGQCRSTTPGMFITGHSLEDRGRPPKKFMFDLR